MLMLAGVVLLWSAAWMVAKRYERHLQRQIGPWMTSEPHAVALRNRRRKRVPPGPYSADV